jgi:hypothetical protein
MAADSKDEDRLFVRDGWRHYRRRYSLSEVRWGLACLGVMAAIALWVAWKGAHPADPSLFADGTALLKAAAPPPAALSATPAPAPMAGPAAAGTAAPARGPLPAGLAGAGWREEKVSEFDPENLYVKIDGRADYFKAFGFKRLHDVLLVSEKDPAITVDVELYDLGSAPNALGAYGGERPPTAKLEVTEGGMQHFDRNALYMVRGPYYLRVIGSDETPAIAEALRGLAGRLGKGIEGEPLPWAYGFFVGQLGIGADKITYFAENAFSLGFAHDVWTARPRGKNDDLELFVAAQEGAPAARALAGKLKGAFLELGQAAGKADGVPLVKDQFLGLFSGAAVVERWVVGVRGAADRDAAAKELARLREAIAGAPPALKDRARPRAAASGGGDEGGSGEH